MSVSLDEQRFSRVHGDGEPDFIELPATRSAPGRLPQRRAGAPGTRRPHITSEAHDQPTTRPRIRTLRPHEAGLQMDRQREPAWKRVLVSLITFERSTGYAISIVVHLFLIIILSLFIIGGSNPTPKIVIETSLVEEQPVLGEVLDTELVVEKELMARVPIIGDVESVGGDGLGRFHGEDGAEFFGLRAGGRDFVYIVDCSGSMQGAAFARARRELLDSIDELKRDQRFYVMFYADSPYLMFNQSGPPTDLVRATDHNKDRLRDWAARIDADGGTEPEQALEWALALRPDAVFLLTDGRFDDIVDGVTAANGDSSRIHTIAFMNSAGEELLRRMADQNGGTYRFVP